MSLLPANRTPFEEALEAVFTPDLVLSGEPVRRLRHTPNEQVIPWLIWEYGLTEIAPYIDDPYRLIRDGILWQRERGTPAAVYRAMAWVNQDGRIEQEDGVHWADIQLSLQSQPDERTLHAVRMLTRLSIPARTRLARIHDAVWDVRRTVLDGAALDESLLSDWSGVVINGVVHSFGKRMATGFVQSAPRLDFNTHDIHTSHTRLQDRVLLDYAALGERPVLNHPVLAGAIQSGGVRRTGQMPRLTVHGFSHDGIVLSDSMPDACWLDPRIFEPAEIHLLDDMALDDRLKGGRWRSADEFSDRGIGISVTGVAPRSVCAAVSGTCRIAHPRATLWPVLDVPADASQSSGTLSSEQGMSAVRTGRTWQIGWMGGWDSATLIGGGFADVEAVSVSRPQAQSVSINQTERMNSISLSVSADDCRTDDMTAAVQRTSHSWQTAWTGRWTTDTNTGASYVSAD